MLSPQEAQQLILASIGRLGTEPVSLYELVGRVLHQPIELPRAQPPFHRVTMDGIALASSAYATGRREFAVAGTQPAGAPPLTLTDLTHCLEVMTGAMLPHGADSVVPIERIQINNGVARIADDFLLTPHVNVHLRGLDAVAGAQVLRGGEQLGPTEVAVIASAGLARVVVSKTPRIAVISTGDELIEPGEPVQEWQIYRSNAYAVHACLQRRHYNQIVHDHLPDDVATLRVRIAQHLATRDALILSGGVSMGRFDFLPQVLNELGVRAVFHHVAQRPGKPMWFGIGAQGQAVYALPGNPVSTLVCLVRYVLAGLEAAMGQHPKPAEHLPLATDVEVKPALSVFMPVKLHRSAGVTRAEPKPTGGSGDFISLLGTDGFVELPKGPGRTAQDALVPFYSW